MPMRVTNIAGQIGALGKSLPKNYAKHWKGNYADMLEEMGGTLADLVDEQFKKGTEPDGSKWKAYAPLTRKVYAKTGQTLQLGGTTMRRSFQIGQRGNFWKPTKRGFTYGSKLKPSGVKKRVNAAQSFGQEYKIPKSVDAAQIFEKRRKKGKLGSASAVRRARKRQVSKAAKVRAYMGAVAGVHAPGVGKQLTHPARATLYWTAAYQQKILDVAERALVIAIERAYADTRKDVETAQAGLDAKAR